MRIHRAILTYLLQVRLLEGRCNTAEEVARYLSMLGLGNAAVKRRIEALVKQGLVETRGNTVCVKKDLRAILVVAGND
jgi:predicted ArsR family transcriptional regulator